MIKTLPAKYPEIGRIRLGEKGSKGEPRKGTHLRFTSNDEHVLRAVAAQLGGEVKPWPKGEQTYQLTTESSSVNVYLPPDALFTAYERWGSGGCQRRCDGEHCTFLDEGTDGAFLNEAECRCLADGLTPGDRGDEKKGACKVTVRLRLVIPDVPGIGTWTCTSHSLYAAMELPGQLAILRALVPSNASLIPATFAIEARREKKPWEPYAREYIVPVLRVRQSLAELMNGEPMRELAPPTLAADSPSPPPQRPPVAQSAQPEGNGQPPEGKKNPYAEAIHLAAKDISDEALDKIMVDLTGDPSTNGATRENKAVILERIRQAAGVKG